VGILEMGFPARIIPGVASSSPDKCIDQSALVALCDVKTNNPAGVEHLEFKIAGVLGDHNSVGDWNLNVTTALVTSNTLVPNSGNSIGFTISILPMKLTVQVPGGVVVSVDGAKQPPGPLQLPVSKGPHNLTLPAIVDVDNATRLRFSMWKDGYAQPNRTVTMTTSMTYEAVYVTQFRLKIDDQTASGKGEGWYDPGSIASYSVSDSQPMSGILGLLGGILRFQAWEQDGKFLSNSSVGLIIMDKPHVLTVLWRGDYTMPIIVIAALAIVIALAIILGYLLLRRRVHTKTRTKNRR
jgi:hypothetical protein